MGLTVVPEPILHQIGAYISSVDVVHLTHTCKYLHHIFNNVDFWKIKSLQENHSLSPEDIALIQLNPNDRNLVYKASTLSESSKSHAVFKKLIGSSDPTSEIMNLISRNDNRNFILARLQDFQASKVYYENDPLAEEWEFFQNNGEEIKAAMLQSITEDQPYEEIENKLKKLILENPLFSEKVYEEMKTDTEFMCNFLAFLFPEKMYLVLERMKKGLPEFLMQSYVQFIAMASLQHEIKDLIKKKEKSYQNLIFFNHLETTQIYHLKKAFLFKMFKNFRLLSEAKILYSELMAILARIPEKTEDINLMQTEKKKAIFEAIYAVFPLLESCLEYQLHGKEFNADFIKELEISIFRDSDFKTFAEVRRSLLICCTAVDAMIKALTKDLNLEKMPKTSDHILESFSFPS